MSDSFADLWKSSAPPQKQQTLSSLAQQQQRPQQNRPQRGPDLFTLLSSASSSPSRPPTRSPPSLRSLTPSTNVPKQPVQQTSIGADAFSDLFSTSSSTPNQHLTIAQRTALNDKQLQETGKVYQNHRFEEPSAWAGLDSLAAGGLSGPTPTPFKDSENIGLSQFPGGIGDDDDFMSVFNKPPLLRESKPDPPQHPQQPLLPSSFSRPSYLVDSSGDHGTPSSRSTNSSVPITRQQQHASRQDREALRHQKRRGDTSSPSFPMGTDAGDIQAQAEQLLAQASEIGRGMFTKASLFWKEKKEQVQKAVEDHRGSSNASGESGRPKWMHQQQQSDEEGEEPPRKRGSRDDVKGSDRFREDAAPPSAPADVGEPVVDLFEPSPISSRSNRQPLDSKPPHSSSSSTPPLTAPSRDQSSAPVPRQQQGKPKFQRNTSPIPAKIASLKFEGNASFKLGQFGTAETLYTRAIEALRAPLTSSLDGDSGDSMYFVLLLNNRANARMKNGDVTGAVNDCEGVIELITLNRLKPLDDDFNTLNGGGISSTTRRMGGNGTIDWEPNYDLFNTNLSISILGNNDTETEPVDLIESLTKAIKRRAEAFEGLEKWTRAKSDWEWLRGCMWARESVRGEAGRGVGRCVRMVGGAVSTGGSVLNGAPFSATGSRPSPAGTTSNARPRAGPVPSTSADTNADNASSALNVLRATTALAEAEDQVKHELKDTIDAKLSTWKSGKENNIRALLASLDSILWSELVNNGGGTKVGMHELVTPAQVKVKYMKAVAKVHPDKLNASNSTLEQRMIAQGVFGALSEAWNAFKQ